MPDTSTQPHRAIAKHRGFPFVLGSAVSTGTVEVTWSEAVRLFWELRAIRMKWPGSDAEYVASTITGATDESGTDYLVLDSTEPFERVSRSLNFNNVMFRDEGGDSQFHNYTEGAESEDYASAADSFSECLFEVTFRRSTNAGMIWLICTDMMSGAIALEDNYSSGSHVRKGYGEFRKIFWGDTSPSVSEITQYSFFFESGTIAADSNPTLVDLEFDTDVQSGWGTPTISAKQTLTLAGIDFPYYRVEQIYDHNGGSSRFGGTGLGTGYPEVLAPTSESQMFAVA